MRKVLKEKQEGNTWHVSQQNPWYFSTFCLIVLSVDPLP